ncbi:unnamed protein product [Brassica oleracea]|uniref:CBF1-interacting co-repressor CIR N-terminal domain-containing protein n=1 Tax=Brassica oleracea var. oleracea TaxID=109376 RepID=A0A0D3B6P2_BRAOL
MGMKFLNKKGWHTGSLRNIENVWKAEQKQEAEQKKLEELRLQIVQEKEQIVSYDLAVDSSSECARIGILKIGSFGTFVIKLLFFSTWRQERLEFLYDSGLAVGKGSASGSGVSFQKEEQPLANAADAGNGASEKPDPSAPGALFEDKTPSANDSWRKLHSDPLLLIRQREQEALARIKNNPVKMALIRKSVEEKGKGKDGDKKEHKKRHKHKSGKQHRKETSTRHHSDSEEDSSEENGRKSHHHRSSVDHDEHYERRKSDLDKESKSYSKHYERQRPDLEDDSKRRDRRYQHYERRRTDLEDESKRRECHDKHYERRRSDVDDESKRSENRPSEKYRSQEDRKRKTEDLDNGKHPSKENGYQNRRRNGGGSKLSEEERAARFKLMQMDAEVHEEQRWRRLKKADETDAVEASKNKISTGKSFLDEANKSVYEVEKGGSSTIEESVRRRSYYSQRGNEAEGNAFRR